MSRQQSPFNPFDRSSFSLDRCFLCSKPLGRHPSKEHVFPKWLLHRVGLWDQSLVLLNRTSIPYRRLVVPCCPRCNGVHLARLEAQVQSAFDAGYDTVAKLPPLILYQWATKIFYSLLFRELSLPRSRSAATGGSITSPELMRQYRALHGFLQSIRTPLEFKNFFPGSVFVLRLDAKPELGLFDFSDNFVGMALCLRAADIGVIVTFADDGLVAQQVEDLYVRLTCTYLHPMQFDEFCAGVFYLSVSQASQGSYVSVTPKVGHSTVVKVPGFSLAPAFAEWDNEVFAWFLASFWEKYGISYTEVFVPPNSIRTTLADYL